MLNIIDTPIIKYVLLCNDGIWFWFTNWLFNTCLV